MSWENKLAGLHLVNQNGTPIAGGNPASWYTSPFAIGEKWTPVVARAETVYSGGQPFSSGQRPLYSSYANVEDTIPIAIVGSSADNAAQLLQQLKRALMTATCSTPAIWQMRPGAATNYIFADVYEASVQETADEGLTPIEGGYNITAEITLRRSPFFGVEQLATLLSAQSFTNKPSANVVSLGSLYGDLVYEGQPLNFTIAKPTSAAAASVILASVHDRKSATGIASAQTTTSQTTGAAFTATSALDVSALRTRAGLTLRVLARLKTLTSPSKAEIQATIQTAAGSALWVSDWVRLSTDTAAQLIDCGGSSLDSLRVSLAATLSVKIAISIRSSDGTSVTATLDYVEALLCYDFCVVECSGGLSAGQSYRLLAAQNLSGGGWLPALVEQAIAVDATPTIVKTARVRGTLPRAFSGASLWVAWRESDGGHTDTDTSTVSVSHAPLYRSLRGAS